MALDPLMMPATSLTRPTRTFAAAATMTVRRVAVDSLRFLTALRLAWARRGKPDRAPAAISHVVVVRFAFCALSRRSGFVSSVSVIPPRLSRLFGAGPHATGGAPGGARAPIPPGDGGYVAGEDFGSARI